MSASTQLRAELSKRACAHGANSGAWPGLTIYRFTRPTLPRWDEIESLSLGLIAQGGGAQTAVAGERLHGQTHFVVIGRGSDFDCQILEASPTQPALCLVVQISPELVRSVSESMQGAGVALGRPHDAGNECAVVTPDVELVHTVMRFVGSLSPACDRRVLAPLRLQELVYRVLQSDLREQLLALAAYQAMANPVAAALDYIPGHLAEPLTVEILAAQVCLSPSAFSRAFRDVTGRSPYQYVKAARLDRARRLLDDGRRGVADVSRAVGYTSVSHFIKGFRNRFGVTPGDYADAHMLRCRVAS
ncbi:AraC family transcriptional regulator [Mycobacterium neglectum]|jgi:AraC-like DNA-binding protein|uniref:AraC family transcriptional regulator n=1 Tax=Mycobacterium neglectum TaxID=242737 RepID=UPI00159BDF6E|nr:AraC family transcriptional regulator [Mycobacterium neglectum]